LLAKQKQQALRNSGALYGANTRRFDGGAGAKEEKKVGGLFLGLRVWWLMDRMRVYRFQREMRMRMLGFRRCLLKMRISGNRCKRICLCESQSLHLRLVMIVH
jgi:hypothetical protein